MKKIFCLSLLGFTFVFAETDLKTMQTALQEQKELTKTLQIQVNTLIQESQKSFNKSASFSQTAYLPDIALILNMSTLGRSVNNGTYQNFIIPGFIDAGNAALPFNKLRGFNFNYAEVAMHSMVDPYFEAFAIFHLQSNEFEIGEAYVQTTSLPYSLRMRAGKFKSSFGRINAKHQHAWYFDTQPLIYKALFGPDSISDAGVQLQWIAPTDTYIMAGAEALQGTNERSFGDIQSNNLYVGYLKSSIDINDDLSLLGGVSLAHGKNTTGNTTNVYGIDLTLRQQLGSYSALIWQSEYLERHKNLGLTTDTQAGLYSELVYQYDKNYAGGFRYDRISKNDTDLTTYVNIDIGNLERYSTMIEYTPFPMSRLRLSYAYDKTKIIAGERKNIHEVMLSLNIAAGAHGAHNY